MIHHRLRRDAWTLAVVMMVIGMLGALSWQDGPVPPPGYGLAGMMRGEGMTE